MPINCCVFGELLLLVYLELTNYETFIIINASIFLIYVCLLNTAVEEVKSVRQVQLVRWNAAQPG